jgi:hypothetical protein
MPLPRGRVTPLGTLLLAESRLRPYWPRFEPVAFHQHRQLANRAGDLFWTMGGLDARS